MNILFLLLFSVLLHPEGWHSISYTHVQKGAPQIIHKKVHPSHHTRNRQLRKAASRGREFLKRPRGSRVFVPESTIGQKLPESCPKNTRKLPESRPNVARNLPECCPKVAESCRDICIFDLFVDKLIKICAGDGLTGFDTLEIRTEGLAQRHKHRNGHENSRRESCEFADRCILHRISVRIYL